jgi:hypothetical protein
MNRKLKDFSTKDKIKCLLWCQRHCCLCEKICGVDIEVAHINQNATKELDNINNAIPLCYDCHAKIGHYNKNHPKGNKYGVNELKERREQIYEKYTRHLVPPVHFEITQNLPNGSQRTFPDIGFNIMHLGDSLPVRVLVNLELFLDGQQLSKIGGHYSEKEFWNLNPRLGYQGHFTAPDEVNKKPDKRFDIKVYVTIIDQYERHHKLLPVNWVYERSNNSWWANP